MASRQKLLEVSAITDCETGMYEIGEVDFGINMSIEHHIRKYGHEEILLTLAHLIYEVKRTAAKLHLEEMPDAAAGE